MPSHTPFGGSGPLLLGVSWTLGFVGVAAVTARWFHARKTPNGKWRWDYIWAHLAAKCALLSIILLTIATSYGLGNDVWNLSYNDLTYAIFFTFMTLAIGVIALLFAKLSVIALLLAIEEELGRKRRIALYAIAVISTVANLLVIPANYTRCYPVRKIWDVAYPGKCDYHFSRYMGMTQSCESCSNGSSPS